MTEAVRLVTDYLLDHLGAQRVEIRCNALNTHSAAVALRLGFTQEGRLRNVRLGPDTSPADSLIFSRIPTDPR